MARLLRRWAACLGASVGEQLVQRGLIWLQAMLTLLLSQNLGCCASVADLAPVLLAECVSSRLPAGRSHCLQGRHKDEATRQISKVRKAYISLKQSLPELPEQVSEVSRNA